METRISNFNLKGDLVCNIYVWGDMFRIIYLRGWGGGGGGVFRIFFLIGDFIQVNRFLILSLSLMFLFT